MLAPFLKSIAGSIIKITSLAVKLTKLEETIACNLLREEGLFITFFTERVWFLLVIRLCGGGHLMFCRVQTDVWMACVSEE